MTTPPPDDVQALIAEARSEADYQCGVGDATGAWYIRALADALERSEARVRELEAQYRAEFEIATHWHDIAMKLHAENAALRADTARLAGEIMYLRGYKDQTEALGAMQARP